MNHLPRTLTGAAKQTSAPLFSRSFSSHHSLQVSKAYYDKLRLNPEALRHRLDKDAEYKKVRYETLPGERERQLAYVKRWHQAHKDDEVYQFILRFRRWCFCHAWVRERLPWKSHRPVLHDVKVRRQCSGCNWARRGGAMLWFQDLKQPDSWLCMQCYVPRDDLSRAMPKGYEDVKSFKELCERRDGLMGASAADGPSMPSQ